MFNRRALFKSAFYSAFYNSGALALRGSERLPVNNRYAVMFSHISIRTFTAQRPSIASRPVAFGRSVINIWKRQQYSTTQKQIADGSKPSGDLQPKKPLWTRIKEEAEHYWLGTRLLAKEIRISTRLLWRMGRGIKLTRREHNQLVRTAKDLFRLIPFAVFIIVPFMELLLPVALKLFPNMLPSTYSSQEKEDSKRRQLMASKLQLARFLRDSIDEGGISKSTNAQEFAGFFKKYRTSGEEASTEEVMEVCRKFSDDVTLDNLSRPQLVTLCRFIGVNAFGTDNFLRYVLRNKMKEIKQDDRMIMAEGVESLTQQELLGACQARGIRTIDVSADRLSYELQQWLDLQKNNIPSTLIILSKALLMTDKPYRTASDTTEALLTTLTSLPNEVVDEAQLRLSEAEGQVSYKKKLDIIQKEEQKIKDEFAEAQQVKEANEKEEKEKEEAAAAMEQQQKVSSDVEFVEEPVEAPQSREFTDEHIELEAETTADNLTKEQYRQLGETLQVLAQQDAQKERNQLEQLKEDREKFMQQDEKPTKTKLKQLQELDDLIVEIEEYLNMMDLPKEASVATINTDLQGNITTQQLETALKMIRHAPNEDKLKKIVRKLDKDGDGRVFLKEILELSEEVGDTEGVGILKATSKPSSSDKNLIDSK